MQLFLETLFMMSLAVNLTEIVSFSTISRLILWTTFNPHPVVIRSVPPSPDFYQGIADARTGSSYRSRNFFAKKGLISVTRNSKWSANGLGRTKVRINHHRWLDEGKYLFIFSFCDNNYGFRNSVKCGLVLNGKTRLQYTQILTIFETTCTI